jgi:hypothetical protein
MGNWKSKMLCGMIVGLVASALIYFSRDNDPVYQGKPLSRYLWAFSGHGLSRGGVTMNTGEPTVLILPNISLSCSDSVANEAIRKVGTNALPMLARMLSEKDTRLQRWIWETVEENKFLRRYIRMKPPTRGWVSQIRALAAFRELGPLASPAIPRIIPLLKDPDCAPAAVVALLSIDLQHEEDILSLTNALCIRVISASGASPSLSHSTAILALSTFGSRASGATPILLNCLTSTNERVQASAAIALAKVGASADRVVPVIVANLSKTNPLPLLPPRPPSAALIAQMASQGNQRFETEASVSMNILALNEYAGRARVALPILSNLQSHPLSNIQILARETAAKIKADTNSAAR